MARPLRITPPGYWHHVMNRGLERRALFVDDADRERFLALVSDAGKRWGVLPHAYCLMRNHYHLLLEDRDGRLSRAMRHVDGVHTQAFNRRHDRDGPLMRGRFRSRVVQQERYLAEVVRYIHSNPVDAGLVNRARDYSWSSHRAYLDLEARDGFHTSTVARVLGIDTGERREWFDRFVHENVDPETRVKLDTKTWSPFLGDTRFEETCREFVRSDSRLHGPEVPDGKALVAVTPERVIEAAMEVFDVSREQLVRGRRSVRNVPRLVAIAVCRDHTPARLSEIGVLFRIRGSTISELTRSTLIRVRSDPEIDDALRRLRERLSKPSN